MTDDDTASHGAFDCSSSVMPSLAKSKNMLCTFHSIVMKFQEVVYPHLPKKKGTKLLTEKARVYGKPFQYYEDGTFVYFHLAGCQLDFLCIPFHVITFTLLHDMTLIDCHDRKFG